MLHNALAVRQLSLNQGGDGEGGPALRDKELLVRLKQREDYIVLWEERTFFPCMDKPVYPVAADGETSPSR